MRGRPGFKVGHLNVRSLTHKINQLRIDLPQSSFDVFTLSETWLTPETEDRLTTIQNYNIIRWDRQTKKTNGALKTGGGLATYYKDTLDVDADMFKHLNVSNKVIELQWIIIDRPHTKKILLGNVYRPPDGNAAEALELLGQKMEQIEKIDKFELLIMGDFNIDTTNDKCTYHKNIKRFEAEHGIQQLIKQPTRHSKKNHTIIDLAFTNIKYCSEAGVINYNVSDHKPIYIVKKKPRNCKETVTKLGRCYTNYSIEALIEHLDTVDMTPIHECQDTNECWERIYQIIKEAADKICPIVELKIRVNSVKYLNHELIELQKDRDYFIEKSDSTKDPGDQFISDCMVTLARNEIDRARSGYYKNQAEIHGKRNSQKFWRDIKEIDPLAKPTIGSLTDEDTGIRIPDSDLPEKINNFFVGIGAKLAQRFIKTREEDRRFAPTQNKKEFEITPIPIEELTLRLNEVVTTKASGMENINTAFVKSSLNLMINEFHYLVNKIIETGVYPDSWKTATVTPIPKIANPKTCGDLRPISILPMPGRVLEKYINESMKNQLEATGYLADQQNGFRKGRSTTKSLGTLIDELLTGMDAGEFAVTVYIDFKKAFDTVNHELLLWKLKRAGMGINTCKLIQNYLTNRTQVTRINGITSTLRQVNTGVPQGSTLGPLLFTIFINDMPNISALPLYTLFADDATLTIRGKNIREIEVTLNKILNLLWDWCEENHLTLNTKKTEYMIVGSKTNKSKAGQLTLILGKEVLREVQTYRYLGTTLDANMNGIAQLNKLNQIMAMKLNTFRKIRKCMSENTAIKIYKATILPIFDYNDIIYELLNGQQLAKIQRIQNKALRTVFLNKNMTVLEMHDRAKVEPLEDRRRDHMLALMLTRSMEAKYIDTTPRQTRSAMAPLLKVPRPRTNKLKKAPIYKGSTLWNNLPARLRRAKSKLEFKVLNKQHRSGLLLDWSEDQENSIVIIE